MTQELRCAFSVSLCRDVFVLYQYICFIYIYILSKCTFTTLCNSNNLLFYWGIFGRGLWTNGWDSVGVCNHCILNEIQTFLISLTLALARFRASIPKKPNFK